MIINRLLAKAIVKNYPQAEDAGLSEIVDPTLEKLYSKVGTYDDSLLTHIIIELTEGAQLQNGDYCRETAINLLERSRDDIQAIGSVSELSVFLDQHTTKEDD